MIEYKIEPNFILGVWGDDSKGALGMVNAPGRAYSERENGIEEDLRVLKEVHGANTIVSLLSEDERELKRREVCKDLGLKHLSYPIEDFSVPQNTETFKKFVQKVIQEEIQQNRIIVVHCAAGIGRTGLFAACCLVFTGINPDKAINLVRSIRQGTIETAEQEEFVRCIVFE